MKSIVIIFPYFGKLPPQYKMWRASALRNPSIDFLFFTDADVENADNIKVERMTFNDFRKVMQQAFDFTITLDRPYKLCEYKPAYGYALQKYIAGYDLWGFGDLDLVYGDLRAFITDEVTSRYKMLSGWGHLSLFSNDTDTNTYFMQHIDGYQDFHEAFTTSDIVFFDEFDHKGCGDKWRDCRPADCWLEWPFDNVSKPKQAYHFNSLNRGWERVLFEHKGTKLYMIRIKDGLIERRETMYAHFQHRPFMRDNVTDYSHFLVTPRTVIDWPNRFTDLRLRLLCRDRNLMTKYYQWRDRIIYKLNMSKYR